jgi:hypothetical protein
MKLLLSGFLHVALATVLRVDSDPQGQAHEAHAKVNAMSWETKGFWICSILLVIVLCMFSCAGAKPPLKEPQSDEDIKQLREQIAAEREKLDADWQRIHDADEEAAKALVVEDDDDAPLDFDKMMQTVGNSLSDQLGAKMANEGAVRKILENRMNNFSGKAKSFLMSKLNVTAKDLMDAVDREEELLLLEWNEAVEATFPPASVVIAGLFSPLMISLNLVGHIYQGFFLFLPVFVMLCVSIYIDQGYACPGVPLMYGWTWFTLILSGILFLAHVMQMTKICSGSAALAAKAQQVLKKLEDVESKDEKSLSDMREMFVGRAILVQQALLIEDECRRSFWYTLVGVGTLLWIPLMIFTLVVVVVWHFIPGMASFHLSTAVSAGDSFCGTWFSVLTARLLAVLGLFFLVINILTVVRWGADCFTHSAQFEKKLMRTAKRFDDGAGGIPVVQILAKAFVLRGSSDTVYAKLNVASNEKIHLKRQEDKLQSKVDGLRARLSAQQAACAAIDAKTDKAKDLGGDSGFGGVIAFTNDARNSAAVWKQLGVTAIQEAESKVSSGADADTSKLDELVQRITSSIDEIRNSDEFKEAQEASKKFAEETAAKAQMYAEEAAKMAAEAAEQAKVMAAEAAQKAQEFAESEEVQKALADAKQKVQETAQAGVEAAQDAAKKTKEFVESEEFQQGVEKAKQTAVDAGNKAVEKGKEAAAVAQEKGAEAAAVAQEKGAEAAAVAQEKGAQAAQVAKEQGTKAVKAGKEAAEELKKKSGKKK